MTDMARAPRTALAAVPMPVLCLLGLDFAMVLLHVVGPPLPVWAAQAGPRDALWDLGRESNVPTWYSSVQLGLIGVMLLGFASVWTRGPRARVILAWAGLVFLFLSLDELAGLHEKFGRFLNIVLGNRSETALSQTGPWMLIVAPVLLAALLLAAYAGRDLLRDRRKVQLLYAAGLVVYVVSFAGLELAQNFVPPMSTGRYLVILVEETGEMVGATLLVWATYELVRSHGIRFFARDAGEPHSRGSPGALRGR